MVTSLGKAIAAYRKANGLTTRAFSEKANVSPAVISFLERGKSWPTLTVLRDIARFLGWSAEEVGEFVLAMTNKAPRCGPKTTQEKFLKARNVSEAEMGAAATG